MSQTLDPVLVAYQEMREDVLTSLRNGSYENQRVGLFIQNFWEEQRRYPEPHELHDFRQSIKPSIQRLVDDIETYAAIGRRAAENINGEKS